MVIVDLDGESIDDPSSSAITKTLLTKRMIIVKKDVSSSSSSLPLEPSSSSSSLGDGDSFHDAVSDLFSPDSAAPALVNFLGRLNDVEATFDEARSTLQRARREFVSIAAASCARKSNNSSYDDKNIRASYSSSSSSSSSLTAMEKSPFPASYKLYESMTPDGLSLSSTSAVAVAVAGAGAGVVEAAPPLEEQQFPAPTTAAAPPPEEQTKKKTNINIIIPSQQPSSSSKYSVGLASKIPRHANDSDDDDDDSDDDDRSRTSGATSSSSSHRPTKNVHGRRPRVTANVPSLDSDLVLDATGAFVDTTLVQTTRGVRSSKTNQSFKMEDSIMDKRKKVSYIEITSREKNEVFQLPAVRRSMRHLNYANVLMTDEVLTLANRYMEIGPSRASLLHIGYETLQVSCGERNFDDEMEYISPLLKWAAWIRGYHPLFWFLTVIVGLMDNGYFIMQMTRAGEINIVMAPIVLGCVTFFFLTLPVSGSVAFGRAIPRSADTPIDEIHLTGVTYLRLKGLETLGKAQHRLAAEKGRRIAPEADLLVLKREMTRAVVLEAFTIHFLFGITPFFWSAAVTIRRSFDKGDTPALVLACGVFLNRLVMALTVVQMAMHVRFCQKLSEFEVRRTEADIR